MPMEYFNISSWFIQPEKFGSPYAVLDVEPTCDERDEDDAMQTDISEQTMLSLSSWRP